jgi:hypothetical protein
VERVGSDKHRRAHSPPPLASRAERATPVTRRMAWVKLIGSLLILVLVIIAAAMSLL